MGFKRKIYKHFPVIPRTNYMLGVKLHKLNLRLSKDRVKRKLKGKSNILANIGCGAIGEPYGWINLDYSKYKNVTYAYDCSNSLPFEDNSVQFIYSEHFFEHLDYKTEAIPFLAECHRTLHVGGVLRIIIPDAGKYLLAYADDGWESLKKTRPLTDDLEDLQMGYKYNTKMELINEVFRQSGEHKFAWDYETLEHNLRKLGFSTVQKQNFGEGFKKDLCLDLKVREPESLYVEAIK